MKNLDRSGGTVYVYQPTQIYSREFEERVAHRRPGFLTRIFQTVVLPQAYYKANPRSLDYCIKNATEHASTAPGNSSRPHFLFLGDVQQIYRSETLLMETAATREQFLTAVRKAANEAGRIVLLYPDAIGQGFSDIEAVVAGQKADIYVLNGRKRFFRLIPSLLKELRVRRFIEKYLLLECMTSIVFPFLSLPYSLYERLTRRSAKKGRDGSLAEKGKGRKIYDGESDQDAVSRIEDYWATRPQTYYGVDDGHTEYIDEKGNVVKLELGDRTFFDKVDETFYSWNKSLHQTDSGGFLPFVRIFPYEKYQGEKVLEIGCGMGTMAMNWARQGARLFAVDLNSVAVEQTRKRFSLFNLNGEIRKADARHLPFDDSFFDYVYSWGVLHHSPDIEKSMGEVYRVLKPGGRVGVMLYHRRSIMYLYMTRYLEGFLHLESKFLSLLQLSSRYGDGYREEGNPYTFPVTKKEILKKIMPQFRNIKIRYFGTEMEWMFSYLCFPYSTRIPLFLRKSFARRFGWSMWIEAEK